eukprot:scaffold530_cov193-Alexandrium_tamarense.AAC.35
MQRMMDIFGTICTRYQSKQTTTQQNKVIILEFEVNDSSLSQLYNAIDQSGLDKFIYRPPSSYTEIEWPTMQTLIDANTRVLVFAHGDGMQSCATMSCPEGVMYTYDHFAQTAMGDTTSCDATRDNIDGFGYYLMNHFENDSNDLPSEANAEKLNSYDYLEGRFGGCEERVPSVVAVDFWDVGDVLNFAKDSNVKRAKR